MVTLENTTWKIPFCAACYTDSNYKHTYSRQSQTGQNMSYSRQSQTGQNMSYSRQSQTGQNMSYSRQSQTGQNMSYSRQSQTGQNMSSIVYEIDGVLCHEMLIAP